MKNFNYPKILILGESLVGKSSILSRISENSFTEYLNPTLGIDFKIVKIYLKNYKKEISMQIWDTAGQERFKSITESFFKGTHGVLIVFDLCNKNSFNKVQGWINSVKEKEEKIILILVGNKSDLRDCNLQTNKGINNLVNKNDIDNILEINDNITYYEVSAKTNNNIKDLFVYLAEELNKTYIFDKKDNKAELNTIDNKQNRFCC